MSELILYHYPMSPFAEKVRTMLGYADLAWQSVSVREMPPRPVLKTLAGGYRKIPVAQMGADVFCDTRVIAAEISRIAGKDELDPAGQSEEATQFITKTDKEIFMACVIAASDHRLLKKLIKSTSLWNALLFMKDRIAMGKKARMRAPKGPEAKQAVLAHVATMESMLNDDFLFGPEPTLADFSAYHGLWFVMDLAGKPWLSEYPRVKSWLARMKGFGHGRPKDLDPEKALDLARDAKPRPLPTDGSPKKDDEALLGNFVDVAPDDYGLDATRGKLIWVCERRVIIERADPRVGTVNVHFPREGYRLSAVIR